MLKREDLLKKITRDITLVQVEVENRGIIGLRDINITAEDFFAGLLNRLFDYALVNLNDAEANSAAIDLGDKAKRVSFQVTSDGRKTKIQDTLKKFHKHNRIMEYDELNILIVGKRVGKYEGLTTTAISFDPIKNILDVRDLIRNVKSMETSRLEVLGDFLDVEIGSVVSDIPSDRQAIEIYRDHFDRRAFVDPMEQEGNMERFRIALTELNELITTGCINHVSITKSWSRFTDRQIHDELKVVLNHLRALLRLYRQHVLSGEIREEYNFACFNDLRTVKEFNILKQDVIKAMNKIGSRYSLSTITFGD